jgi:hypothetical protein
MSASFYLVAAVRAHPAKLFQRVEVDIQIVANRP